MKPAALALEDGTFLLGESYGAEGERSGELVFNTSMTGYQEVITDPSYKGQIVVMTSPEIGNYGVTREDMQAGRPFLEGFVVREGSRTYSNWQAVLGLGEYLSKEGIVGIQGLDTRALAKTLRVKGALRAVLSSRDLGRASLVRKARATPSMVGRDLVGEVTAPKSYDWKAAGKREFHVVAIDYGVKLGILRCLEQIGARTTVVPARTSVEEILGLRPDGVLLSNGPGDPEPLSYAIGTAQRLVEKRLPVFGICLGHQILGLAFGGRSYKLKFGHRGANHPVQETGSGKVLVTTQNHGFAIDARSLPRDVRATHVNLNDGTLEGFEHAELPVFSVQFHPEASAGPHDARRYFDRFREMILRRKG